MTEIDEGRKAIAAQDPCPERRELQKKKKEGSIHPLSDIGLSLPVLNVVAPE